MYESEAFYKKLDQQLKRSELKSYINSNKEMALLLEKNVTKTIDLLNYFKSVRVDRENDTPEESSLFEVVNRVINDCKLRFNDTQTKFVNQVDTEIIIYQYTQDVIQIFNHLLTNAIENNRNSPNLEIIVSGRQNGGNISLDVSDNGKGIQEKDVTRIFEPFYTHQRSEGKIGLGLHIVFILVSQKLGGDIKLQRSGQLTKFVLDFPARRLVNTVESQEVDTEFNALVVDDSTYYRDHIGDILEFVGFRVYKAPSSLEAIDFCEKYNFELITIDYHMPMHSGSELLDLLQSKGLINNTKIFVISGECRSELEVKVSVSGFVLKPMNDLNFKKAVNRLFTYSYSL